VHCVERRPQDFRSENGLYSMIQAQYDAALQNPPWESRDEYDIDDRPKKKRRRWYYEVVRQEDGEVVQVIDEECQETDEKQENSDGASENANEILVEAPQMRRSSLRSISPRQQQPDSMHCSSPLSSPPATPTDTADIAPQSTVCPTILISFKLSLYCSNSCDARGESCVSRLSSWCSWIIDQ